MKFRRVLNAITGGIDATIRALGSVACVAAGIMTLLVVSNVLGRFLFKQPLLGIVELVEMMMVIIGFFAIAYTAIDRGHVRVDLVLSRLSRRTQAILGSIAFFLSAVIFAIITYQGSVNTIYYIHHLKEASTVLSVPFAPFRFVMALGCLLLCLRLLADVFRPLSKTSKEEQKGESSK